MNIKLSQLIPVHKKLSEIIDQEITSFKLMYLIKRFYMLIDNEIKLYMTTRDDLIRKYGDKDNEGNYKVVLDTDAGKQYLEEHSKIISLDLNLQDNIPKIPISLIESEVNVADVTNPKRFRMTAMDLIILEDFIDEEN
jgi:hypothetical protein